MNNTIILYKSKYGATKKYGEWLSNKLDCDLVETRSAKIDHIAKYDTVILGGGIYASGIAGLSFFKKNLERLKGRRLIVFAVGASPYDEKAMRALREHNFKNELTAIPCFYCRGAWNESAMTLRDKVLCSMLKSAVSQKDASGYEPWESALMEAIGLDADWTDEEYLVPIIEYVNAGREKI